MRIFAALGTGQPEERWLANTSPANLNDDLTTTMANLFSRPERLSTSHRV